LPNRKNKNRNIKKASYNAVGCSEFEIDDIV